MDLIQMMRSENSKSKKWYRWRLGTNIISLLLSVISAFWWNSIVLSFLFLSLPIATLIFTELSSQHYERAEKIRRLAMLHNSLEYQPSAIELKKLVVESGKIKDTEPPFISS